MPTSRQQYTAGSAAPEETTIVLDSPYDRHISHARDGAGSEVSPHRLTSLLPSHGVRQTGPSAIYVSMYYISRTWSWVKPTIWLPSPPISLTIHTGAQLHGEPRGFNPNGKLGVPYCLYVSRSSLLLQAAFAISRLASRAG